MIRQTLHLCRVLVLLSGCGSAWADIEPLAEDQLAQVWGQAALSLTNTQANGMAFTRVTLNADIDLSANIDSIQAGVYQDNQLDLLTGTGVAADIGALQFGRSDLSDAQRLVTLNNPYLEFVYEADMSTVVGMRIGFEGVSGDIGTQLNILSGALRIDLGDDLILDSLNDPMGGVSWDGLRCIAGATCLGPLSDIGVLRAGSTAGPSRDFFVSVLTQPVTFPKINGVATPQALQGIWLNWRDRLSGTIQAMPPNQPIGF